jgi:hypothetical protein
MVSIQDDGLGFSSDFDLNNLSESGHFGLLGISERVALLGGRMRLQRQPQGGSLLQVEIPHPRIPSENDKTNPPANWELPGTKNRSAKRGYPLGQARDIPLRK